MEVGDFVRIKENLIVDEGYGGEVFVYSVKEYRGKQAKITRISRDYYSLDIDMGNKKGGMINAYCSNLL